MSYPDRYTRQYDFQAYQNANPTRPLPGDKVNVDFNQVAISIDGIVDFLEGFTRSDGALANGSVGVDQLTAGVRAAIGVESDSIAGSEISYDNTTSGLTATDLQAAIDEIVLASGAISSVFGRTGAITATAGDYTASKITNDSAVSGSFVDDALETLNSGKQAADATLTALAAVVTAANKVIYATGSDSFTTADFTAYGRSVVAVADEAAFKALVNLEIGTDVQAYDAELAALAGLTSAADKVPYFTGAGTAAVADFSAYGRTLIDDADASAARTTLGLVIGTNVQAYDATLASIAALGTAADRIAYTTGIDTWAETALTAAARSILDDASVGAIATTLGLGTGDSPQFTAVNVGHASDTTITRVSAGVIAVEGSNVLLASGLGSITQAYDAELAALAGLTSAADKLPYFTGSGTAALADFTSFGRSIVDDADAAAVRTTLGLVIGTNVQAYDADLATIAGLTATTDHFLQAKASAWTTRTPTQVTADLINFVGDSGSGGTKGLVPAPASGDSAKFLKGDGTWTAIAGGGDLLSTNNLSDVANAATAATNLGLGTGNSPQFTGINVGHASDTTITRTGAGAIAVEGVGVALNSTSLAHTASTIELGHASDTTLSRSAAGRLAVEGANLAFVSEIREKLTANRTYYVATSGNGGSDSNTGLSGSPFLTLQKAWDTVLTIDLNGFAVTISIGTGTFTGGVSMTAPPVGGRVTFQGNGSANTIISTTSATCFLANQVPSEIAFAAMKVQTTTSGDCFNAVGFGTKMQLGSDLIFGACAGNHMSAEQGGIISCQSNYTINGGASRHLYCAQNSVITMALNTVTLSGTPAWGTAGMVFDTGAVINLFSVTYSGLATGKRYQGTLNAVLQSFGAGTASTYFPGNSNGTTATGAQQG